MAQLDLLNSITTNTFDIILIQEPHIDYLTLTLVTEYWKVIYPSKQDKYPQKTRAVTLVSTRIISDKAIQKKVDLSDITVITINTLLGKTDIYNIYLDGMHTNKIIPMANSINTRSNLPSNKRPKHMRTQPRCSSSLTYKSNII